MAAHVNNYEKSVSCNKYEKFHHYDFDNDQSYQCGLQKIKQLPNFSQSDILKSKIFYFSRSFYPVNVDDYKQWLTEHPEIKNPHISSMQDTSRNNWPDQKASNNSCKEIEKENVPEGGSLSLQSKPVTNIASGERDKTAEQNIVQGETTLTNRSEKSKKDIISSNTRMYEQSEQAESLGQENINILQSSEVNSVTKVISVVNVQNSEKTDVNELSLADVAEYIEKGLTLPGIKELDIKPLEIDPQPSIIQRTVKPWENE